MGSHNDGVNWSYFDKFDKIENKYLPVRGEGDNMATQIVTATAKLVYKWYNDGDVYDNSYYMDGWCNDLSSYANWLYKNIPGTSDILLRIMNCFNCSGYENILKDLVDFTNTFEFLEEYEKKEKTGSIYDCDGPFKFDEYDDDEEDEWYE